MQDHINPANDIVNKGLIENRAEDELDSRAAGVLPQVVVPPRRQVVEDDHRVPAGHECIH